MLRLFRTRTIFSDNFIFNLLCVFRSFYPIPPFYQPVVFFSHTAAALLPEDLSQPRLTAQPKRATIKAVLRKEVLPGERPHLLPFCWQGCAFQAQRRETERQADLPVRKRLCIPFRASGRRDAFIFITKPLQVAYQKGSRHMKHLKSTFPLPCTGDDLRWPLAASSPPPANPLRPLRGHGGATAEPTPGSHARGNAGRERKLPLNPSFQYRCAQGPDCDGPDPSDEGCDSGEATANHYTFSLVRPPDEVTPGLSQG